MNVKITFFFNYAHNYLFEIVSLQKVSHAIYTYDYIYLWQFTYI